MTGPDRPMSDPTKSGDADSGVNPPAGSARIDQLLSPFFRDSSLWPVTIVFLLSLSSFGAALLLVAVDRRNLAAIAALALLLFMSLDTLWRDLRRRRLGATAALILGLWLLSGALALGSLALGLY